MSPHQPSTDACPLSSHHPNRSLSSNRLPLPASSVTESRFAAGFSLLSPEDNNDTLTKETLPVMPAGHECVRCREIIGPWKECVTGDGMCVDCCNCKYSDGSLSWTLCNSTHVLVDNFVHWNPDAAKKKTRSPRTAREKELAARKEIKETFAMSYNGSFKPYYPGRTAKNRKMNTNTGDAERIARERQVGRGAQAAKGETNNDDALMQIKKRMRISALVE